MQGVRATRQNAARALEYTRLTLRQTQGIAVGAVQAEARQLLLHQMHLYRRATAPVCRPTVDTRVSSAETRGAHRLFCSAPFLRKARSCYRRDKKTVGLPVGRPQLASLYHRHGRRCFPHTTL